MWLRAYSSSTTVLHKSLPQTDWHVVSELHRASRALPARGGGCAGGEAHKHKKKKRETTTTPPRIYSRDKSFSNSGKLYPPSRSWCRSFSLAPERKAHCYRSAFSMRSLLYWAGTLRPRKEAHYHNRRPQSHAARGTQPITYQKGQGGGGKEERKGWSPEGKWGGGGRDQRGREGKTQNGQ